MTPDEAIAKLKGLPEAQQRAVLTRLSPEERSGVLAKLQGGAPAPMKAQGKTQFEKDRDPYRYHKAIASGVAEGAKDFAEGAYNTARHPIDTASGLADQLEDFANTKEDEASWQGNLLKTMEHTPIVGGYVQQAESGGSGTASPESVKAGVRAATSLAVAPEATSAAVAGLAKLKLPAPRAVRELVKDTQKANAMEAEKAKAADAEHAQKAQDAAHETRGRELAHEAERRRASIEAKSKNAEAERVHAEKLAETKAANDAAVRQQSKIAPTKDKLTTSSRELQAQIETARANALKEGNAKYSAVNEALNPIQARPEFYSESVAEAASELNGSKPEPTLLKNMERRIETGDPVRYEDLQGDYSILGKELSKGTLDGPVYHAYDKLHEAIGNEMQRIADENGKGPQLTDARHYWRRMKQAFGKPFNPTDAGTGVYEKASPEQAGADEFQNRVRQLGAFDKTIPQTVEHIANVRKGMKSLGEVHPVRDVVKPLPPPPEKVAAKYPAPPERVLPPDRPAEFKPKKIGAEDVSATKAERLGKTADWVRNRGAWAATWPAFHILTSALRGGDLSLGTAALESGGTLAATNAVASALESPRVVKFLSEAKLRDVEAIPPNLRGDFPKIIKAAQAKGIKVSPVLIGAFANASRGPAPRQQHPTDAYQGIPAQ